MATKEKVKSAFSQRANEIAKELQDTCTKNKTKAFILLTIDAEDEEAFTTVAYTDNMAYHEHMLRHLVQNDDDFIMAFIKVLS